MNTTNHAPTPDFFYGRAIPITIDEPTFATRPAQRFRANVYIGPNHFSRYGKTPERAARCLNLTLPAFFAYGDSLRCGWVQTYAEAARYSKEVRRAALKTAKEQK